MPTINLAPYIQSNGQTTDPTLVASAFSTIQTAMNGLENVNFTGGAGIEATKLQHPGNTYQWLRADKTWATPGGTVVPHGVTTAVTAGNDNGAGVDLFQGKMQIAANELSATGCIQIHAGGSLSNTTANDFSTNLELRIASGYSYWKSQISATIKHDVTDYAWHFSGTIQALNSVTSSRASGRFMLSDTSAATTGLGRIAAMNNDYQLLATFTGSASPPFNLAQTILLNAQMVNSDPLFTSTLDYAFVTVMNP